MVTKDKRLYNQCLIRMDNDLSEKLYNLLEADDVYQTGIDSQNVNKSLETAQVKDEIIHKK